MPWFFVGHCTGFYCRYWRATKSVTFRWGKSARHCKHVSEKKRLYAVFCSISSGKIIVNIRSKFAPCSIRSSKTRYELAFFSNTSIRNQMKMNGFACVCCQYLQFLQSSSISTFKSFGKFNHFSLSFSHLVIFSPICSTTKKQTAQLIDQ